MQFLAPLIEAREGITYDSKGMPCMVVVDPATRKLLIPCGYVYPTRAQQRATIPSLCQLFLQGRCRQSVHCHQVHAALDVVMALREQVESLPWCCVMHGDKDYAGVLEKQSWLSNVVLHIPESSFEGGYIPLSRVGYTLPMSKLLNELSHETLVAIDRYRKAVQQGIVLDEKPPRVVLEAGDIPICRLHILDRCRYAEECSFLHVCKEVVSLDPGLPLGRRSRLKAVSKAPMCFSTEPQGPHMLSSVSLTCAKGFIPTPHSRPTSVRGFPLLLRGSGSNQSSLVNSFSLSGDQNTWISAASTTTAAHNPNGDLMGNEHSKVQTTRTLQSASKSGVYRQYKPKVEAGCPQFLHAFSESDNLAQSEVVTEVVMECIPEALTCADSTGRHTSPMSICTVMSDSIGVLSGDEGTRVSSASLLSSSRCNTGGKWRHDPYKFMPLKA